MTGGLVMLGIIILLPFMLTGAKVRKKRDIGFPETRKKERRKR
jgi:hypothetical protein